MVALAPHVCAHRDLHTLRASLCEQYGKMYRAYHATHHHYFKGICKGLHQAVKEIDALLDMPTDLSAERDRLDQLENIARLNGCNTGAGRTPGEDAGQDRDGMDTLAPGRGGAWGTWLTYVLVGVVVLAIWTFRPGE